MRPLPNTSATARQVRALYLDLFGRPPLDLERDTWVEKPLAELVDFALASPVAWRHWLDEQLYFFMLIDRFEPVGTSLDELPKLLAEKRMAPRDALHRIALSTSFEQRNPGADTFVTVVMEQFCGMDVQRSQRELEIGKTAYDGEPGLFLGSKAKSQSDVVAIAATHQSAARFLVEREHLRLLRAECPKKERARTGKRVHGKPAEMVTVYRDWLLSDAYAARVASGAPLSNRAFVMSIYVDLGGAVPSPEVVEALRGALDSLGDPMPLRSLIVRMLLDDEATAAPRLATIPDPAAWIAASFDRLLGRPPRAEEAAAFLEVCRDGNGGPGACLYTLLTSEEYQNA